MIVLDTNVLSEPLKPKPDAAVLNWLDAQAPETLYITTINLAEMQAGIEILPAGRRRAALELAMSKQVLTLFAGRILGFDAQSAFSFATLYAAAQSHGNPISFADCAVAAIAKCHGCAVATRNARDFKGTDVVLIDPWAFK